MENLILVKVLYWKGPTFNQVMHSGIRLIFPMICGWTSDVIMDAMASQITGVSIVCSTVCWGADNRKHQSSVSLALVGGTHRWPADSPHKGSVTRKMFPFDDAIMHVQYISVHQVVLPYVSQPIFSTVSLDRIQHFTTKTSIQLVDIDRDTISFAWQAASSEYATQQDMAWHRHPHNKHYCDVIMSATYGVSNHRRLDCLLNRLFRRRSKKKSKVCVTGLCSERNPPVTGGFHLQRANDAANVSISWCHHVKWLFVEWKPYFICYLDNV